MELARNYLARVGSWVKPANQTPTGDVSLEAIDEQTRMLAKEFVYYFAKNAEPQSEMGIRMRDCVDRVSKEYEVQFDVMISSINLGRENAVEALLNIARCVYEGEDHCNWGRVTIMITFAGFVARKLALQDGDDDDECFLDVFATAFGNYLVNTISQWILIQGGWNTFPPTTATLGNFATIICLGFGVAAACTYTALR